MKKRVLERTKISLILIVLGLLPTGAFGQSAYLQNGSSGMLVESAAELSNSLVFRQAGLTTSFSIAGIFDIGLQTGLRFERLNDTNSTALDTSISIGSLILKEGGSVPFSIQLRGSYGYANFVSSPYLLDNNLRRFGLGYRLEIAFRKDFPMNDAFAIHGELSGGVRSYEYTTESVFTTGGGGASIRDRQVTAYTGAFSTALFSFRNGVRFGTGVRLRYDLFIANQENGFSMDRFSIGPVLSLLIPTD